MDDAAPSSPLLFSFIVPATTEDATDCNDGTARCFPAESTEATDDGKTGVDDAPDDGGLGSDSGGSGRDEGRDRDWDWGAAVSVGGEPNARPSPLVGAAKFAYFSRRTRC